MNYGSKYQARWFGMVMKHHGHGYEHELWLNLVVIIMKAGKV